MNPIRSRLESSGRSRAVKRLDGLCALLQRELGGSSSGPTSCWPSEKSCPFLLAADRRTISPEFIMITTLAGAVARISRGARCNIGPFERVDFHPAEPAAVESCRGHGAGRAACKSAATERICPRRLLLAPTKRPSGPPPPPPSYLFALDDRASPAASTRERLYTRLIVRNRQLLLLLQLRKRVGAVEFPSSAVGRLTGTGAEIRSVR